MSFTQGNTDTIAEGSTNLYYTDTRAKAAISVTDSGGDGSLTYTAGAITYTGPSATETRAHFTAGTGVSYSGGQFSIGQSVGTSSNVTFNNATVSGDLTVSGTTTYINTQTLNIGDNIITLNADETGTPSADAGIEVERGGETNKSFIWDETEDEWSVGSERIKAGTFAGALTGNADTATTLQTPRTIDITGDITATAVSFDGSANIAISASVNNNSHSHTIANVTGLQTEIDTKAELAGSTGQAFSASTVNATTVDLGAWTVTQSGTDLKFAYNGTNRMKLDSSGNLTVEGNVTAYGSA
jgi:cytoskeletal protein CcmA (bactofilin family)